MGIWGQRKSGQGQKVLARSSTLPLAKQEGESKYQNVMIYRTGSAINFDYVRQMGQREILPYIFGTYHPTLISCKNNGIIKVAKYVKQM